VVPIDLPPSRYATTSYKPQNPIPTPDGTTPTSIVISPDGKTAYVICGGGAGGGSVLPIDLATKTAGSPIPISGDPAGIAISADGKTAYVTGRKSSSTGVAISGAIDALWPIDLATNMLLAPLVVGANPSNIVVAP
jgi:DNA-binding beta-propeller fold protein YncE